MTSLIDRAKCVLFNGGHHDATISGAIYENPIWGTISVDFHLCRRCGRMDVFDITPVDE